MPATRRLQSVKTQAEVIIVDVSQDTLEMVFNAQI
jgi:hypothetical protein